MHPNRYIPGQSSAMRKSRLEGKPSLLPKPRRPGSTDRLSSEARRPSTTGHRSSSAEPARGTFGARLSREASATKLQMSGRSRSQQSERFGQSSMTPLRSSHYSRPTTTPQRTPSEDRASRSWQTSLERALAFVTIKDQRPLSNAGWQRGLAGRVAAALAARGAGDAALVRPLTIARFVDIVAALLNAITRDAKLNNDNYVTKLPHLSKRLLYPGTVSKSWLKTVNTLHAFPQALALIAYLVDLVFHIEMPVSDDWLYIGKDELGCLRRDYLYKCWIRFQDPGHQFEDLNEEYLQNLKLLLGNDEEKILELQQVINKYEACLEDEATSSARAEESRLCGRRDALGAALRAARAARRQARADLAAQADRREQLEQAARGLDAEVERATVESQQLKREVEEQPLTLAERTRLLNDVDYAHRVQDSKRQLATQIEKMLLGKETELALWQKKTLDSCVEYKQGLIHLSAQFPDLASLAIDEKELMAESCGTAAARAVEALRQRATQLGEQRAARAATRTKRGRKRAMLLEEKNAQIAELRAQLQHEQECLDSEAAAEAADAAAWAGALRELTAHVDALRARQHEYARVDSDLEFWEKQDAAWRAKLSSMRTYIAAQKDESRRALDAARDKRLALLENTVKLWNEKLDEREVKG